MFFSEVCKACLKPMTEFWTPNRSTLWRCRSRDWPDTAPATTEDTDEVAEGPQQARIGHRSVTEISRPVNSAGVVRSASQSDIKVADRGDQHGDRRKTVGHADPEAHAQSPAQQKVSDGVER